MHALEFYRTVTRDQTNLLERLLDFFAQHAVDYCLIGGQAVNAYVEPLVSLDFDIVIAAADIARLEPLLATEFQIARFPFSLNLSAPGSELRVQIQTDPRYAAFARRAERREVMGTNLRVACLEDVMQGKVWAAQDPSRRGSKRQKDLADIARLLEAYPHLRSQVPEEIQKLLLQ